MDSLPIPIGIQKNKMADFLVKKGATIFSNLHRNQQFITVIQNIENAAKLQKQHIINKKIQGKTYADIKLQLHILSLPRKSVIAEFHLFT